MLPQNGECKINIETDVENEYLIRPHDQGEIKIKIKKPTLGTRDGNDRPRDQRGGNVHTVVHDDALTRGNPSIPGHGVGYRVVDGLGWL